MKRTFTSYPVTDFFVLKSKMLNWLQPFGIFCFLDNQQYNFSSPAFECLAGAGFLKKMVFAKDNALTSLQAFLDQHNDWVFGHLGYDLKNEIEDLSSNNFDGILFPNIFFFIPEVVLKLNEDQLQIGVLDGNPDEIFETINGLTPVKRNMTVPIPQLKSRFGREQYIAAIKKLQQHLLRGDCYEINFCQEFYAEDISVDPLSVYNNIRKFSPNPFSAFYKVDDKYLMCASPERYIRKVDDKIISQPIKGTAKRFPQDEPGDKESKEKLILSDKERAENVMVVDLVRNDLSKVCEEGTVVVDELFGIYSFPQVHQMISTISGIIKPGVTFKDIITATFPMGSMTGAPKKRVMELIELYEKTRRGLFSGSVGYIDPDKNFDFNVVIRSIMYNASNKYLSVSAGAAITFKSVPENEYEECLYKITAMKEALL
ncbi:MAG: anthranilate synthase component I family protein [Chitinophagaceae bacterium]|nr:anthranilate synthase component I family protein [Chitinophagaceae bacterium]